ncbi:unnamed protein product [Ceratitis capitata]|uniref:(Mediterranean fruit fly) hypothetical protein n=1 Tax=Ceratitis capitata TaxID=7213 RepID=A0A811ULS3_CERCA|nr:unnamed protein product [Ceratitis capitata]
MLVAASTLTACSSSYMQHATQDSYVGHQHSLFRVVLQMQASELLRQANEPARTAGETVLEMQ